MTCRRALAGVLVSLLLAACGGSTRTTSASATASATRSPATTTSVIPSGAATASSSSSSPSTATTPATTTTKARRPPEVPAGAGRKTARPRPSVSSGAIIPAAFVITPGGRIAPSSVSVPPGVSISLGVDNRDRRSHAVSLAAARHPTLRLRPGAGGLAIVTGLAIGNYRVLVDGTAEAQLVVGAQGGP